jgi:hypothetical protein
MHEPKDMETPNAAVSGGARQRVRCSRVIMIEVSPSAYPSGMLALGNATDNRGGDLMRFYTNQHEFYCGIDLHARSM